MSIDTSENVQVAESVQVVESVETTVRPRRQAARVARTIKAGKSTEATGRPEAAVAEKIPTTKTAVGLTADSLRRLAVTALAEGKTNSQVVEELIQKHLRRHVLYTRPADSTGEATQAVSEAA